MLDPADCDPNGVQQLLEGFRQRYGPDKGLLDLQQWLESKLQILKRRAKRRRPAEVNVQMLGALVREVRSQRFDVIVRRCAMPRMSPLGAKETH